MIAKLKKLKEQIPEPQQSLSIHQMFFERIHRTWLSSFNLKQEMLNLSKDEANALQNYFYANHLILESKQAAARVSPNTWEEIEERMLRV